MINFNQLRVFYHAAKNESFTKAADSLCISQPGVTSQIKSFENYCNLILFKKRGRKVYLTEEGKALYEYAKKIFDYEQEMENAIEEMHTLRRGLLRLGTTKTYARYFMPFMISNFHKSYPGIRIQLNEGSSLDMIHSLLDFSNEVAIIAKAEDNPEVCFTPFSREELVLIAAPRHKWAERQGLEFEELAEEPLIMKERGSGTRRVVNELFSENNCTPNVLMETSNTEFIKELVQRGEGFSFLVREAVSVELKDKKLIEIPLKSGKIFLDVSIAFLKDQHLSPPARAFLGILRKIAPEDMRPLGIGALMAKMLSKRK